MDHTSSTSTALPQPTPNPGAGTAPLTADDIAEPAAWVIGLLPHMNINRMEIMPMCRAPGPL
jgi:NADP-dependent 3-hydroxy acid dehydrogenase YdfG